jgi:hypothetical protein
MTEGFRRLSQSLQVNAVILPKIRPRPLPSTSFPFRHPLITLLLDSELKKSVVK